MGDNGPGHGGGVDASDHPEHAEPAEVLASLLLGQELRVVGEHDGDGVSDTAQRERRHGQRRRGGEERRREREEKREDGRRGDGEGVRGRGRGRRRERRDLIDRAETEEREREMENTSG